MYLFKKFSLSISLLLLTLAGFLKSENLSDVYELALKNDPLLRAAEATYRAGKENKSQGIAGLLPTLSTVSYTHLTLPTIYSV